MKTFGSSGPAPRVSPLAAGAALEICVSFGVLPAATVSRSLAGSRDPLSAFALVARRPQGFSATARPSLSTRTPSSLGLPISFTAPEPARRSPPDSHEPDCTRPAFLRFPPLRHIPARGTRLFRRGVTTSAPARRPAVSTASPTSGSSRLPGCFHPERPWGFALQSFFPSSERLPSLPGPFPSCRLASAAEPGAACATPGCFGTPAAGLLSHRRIRTSRRGGLVRSGPAALLSFLLLQGFLPGSRCKALRPRLPLALRSGGPSRAPPCRAPQGFDSRARSAGVSRRCLPS